MKTLLSALIIASVLIYSCGGAEEKGEYFGKKIDSKEALTITELETKLKGQDSVMAKVEGKVDGVCQAKGCWMDMKRADGSVMRVTFKDYEFFVPMTIAGKTAVIEGVAKFDTTTVEMLKHYAEDAGKTPEEIATITEPKLELVFEANGVIIK